MECAAIVYGIVLTTAMDVTKFVMQLELAVVNFIEIKPIVHPNYLF